MRLDAVIAAPVASLGLSAILLEPQVTAGFSLSGSGCPSAASPRSARRNSCRVGRQPPCLSPSRSRSRHQSTNVSIPRTRLSASVSKGEGDCIDAVVEEKTAGLALEGEGPENTSAKERKRDMFKRFFRDLASLSLVDYKWRSALFKKQEADRMEEEWMAAMMGEDPAYARPMDAGEQTRGPLGNAERSAVKWLTSVIEEEGSRARRIAESDGELVRPMDIPSDEAGPLSELEKRAIQFLSDITDAEVERARSGTIRPKDSERPGPLGEAEARAVLALNRIVESEKYRVNQSWMRGGEAVRPIDVPGPLGEFERYVGDIIRAERQRFKDRETNEGRMVRPKDASIKSGLSEAEQRAADDWELLRREESERLLNLRRFLDERRPMQADKDSALGVTEAFTVGLLRAPQLIMKTVDRVKELVSSDGVVGRDGEIMRQQQPRSLPESSGDSELANGSTEKGKTRGPSSEGDGLAM